MFRYYNFKSMISLEQKEIIDGILCHNWSVYHNEDDYRINCIDAVHNKGSHYFKEVIYKGTFHADELKKMYAQESYEETKKFERNIEETLKAALEIVTF